MIRANFWTVDESVCYESQLPGMQLLWDRLRIMKVQV